MTRYKAWRIVALAFVPVACAFGQVVPPPAAGGARIACDQATFDFGQADETAVVHHDFTIRNAGTEPLVINRLRLSCGCTAATPSTNTIAPSATAQIKASLTLQGRRGRQSKSITVESNDPTQPAFMLWMNGNVVTELALEPQYVTFGTISGDSNATREVRLVSRRPNVAITNVTCDSSAFKVALVPRSEGYASRFTVALNLPLRATSHGIVTAYTDHPERKELKASVFAMVQQEARVLPTELTLQGPLSSRVERAVMIYPAAVREFQIVSVKAPFDEIKAAVRQTIPGTYRIDLSNIPVQPELDGKALHITTTLTEMKEITVPLRVMIEPPATVPAAPPPMP